MIEIAWYNAIAIIVGIIALVCLSLIPEDKGGIGGGLGTFIGGCLWLFLVVLFYAIWGGIFWW